MKEKKRGLTQKQLEKKSGVSQSQISKIESGSQCPSLDIALALFGALGVKEIRVNKLRVRHD